jgi:hypothetical protein
MHGSELALKSLWSRNSTHEIIMFRALQMDVTPVHCSTHTAHRPAVQLHAACVSLSTEGLNQRCLGRGKEGGSASLTVFFEFTSASAAISIPTMLW